jgi:hypothetical protein
MPFVASEEVAARSGQGVDVPFDLKDVVQSPIHVFLRFAFVQCPAVIIALNVVFGLILSQVEHWTVWVGFLYISSTVCGVGTPLTNSSPSTGEGQAIDSLIALWAIAITGTVIGVAGNMVALNNFTEVYNNRSRYTLCSLAVYVAVLTPFCCAVLSAVFGGLLALSEGWSFAQGFLYVAGNIAALQNPLVDNTPETNFGEILTVVFATLSLVFSSCVMGAVGGLTAAMQCVDRIERLANRIDEEIDEMDDEMEGMVSRGELEGFFSEHSPSNIHMVDSILDRYAAPPLSRCLVLTRTYTYLHTTPLPSTQLLH